MTFIELVFLTKKHFREKVIKMNINKELKTIEIFSVIIDDNYNLKILSASIKMNSIEQKIYNYIQEWKNKKISKDVMINDIVNYLEKLRRDFFNQI